MLYEQAIVNRNVILINTVSGNTKKMQFRETNFLRILENAVCYQFSRLLFCTLCSQLVSHRDIVAADFYVILH